MKEDSANATANTVNGKVAINVIMDPVDRSTGDPLISEPSMSVREGDWVILAFADGRRLFAQCLRNPRGKTPSVRIQKRCYPTFNMIGLPYGTVLEQGKSKLVPLENGEDLMPDLPAPNSAIEEHAINSGLVRSNQTNDINRGDEISEETLRTTTQAPPLLYKKILQGVKDNAKLNELNEFTDNLEEKYPNQPKSRFAILLSNINNHYNYILCPNNSQDVYDAFNHYKGNSKQFLSNSNIRKVKNFYSVIRLAFRYLHTHSR